MNRSLRTLLKFLAPVAVLGIAALAALQLAAMRPQPETRPIETPPPLVRTQRVTLGDRRLIIESQGTVSPRTESRVVPEVSGRVVWVSPHFVSGAFFESGEALLRIDSHDYEQAVVRARADVAAAELRLSQEQAEAELARKEWEQLGRGPAPALTLRIPQLENARASLAAARANLEKAQRDLARTALTAPYAGRVRDKSVDVGQFVVAGSVLGTIYAIDYAEIRLPLPDDQLQYLDLPLVYRGQAPGTGPRVTLTADFAGRTWSWQGRIVRSEGEIDPATRMVHAVAQVDNPYARGDDPRRPPLSAGMFVHARIDGRMAHQVAVIPRAALRADGRILVVDAQDRLHFRQIQVLRSTRDDLVVSAGLAEGERVCLSPLDTVVDGMKVRVLGDDSTQAGEITG